MKYAKKNIVKENTMKIESIHLKNFKAFKDVEIKNIPKMYKSFKQIKTLIVVK
jgi:hypothetical protein